MTPEFEEALGLWESGDLSRDELARRFPDDDVASLLDAFDRMNAASAEPTPDAGVAWGAVRTRLPGRLADQRRGRGKAIRLLAAALIAVLVLGASAYAVVPGVRRAVNDTTGAITRDDDDRSDPTRSAESDGLADEPTNVSDDVGPTTDPDEGTGGENDADADENDDPNAGSGSGSNDDAIEDGSGSGTDDGSGRDEGSSEGGSGSGEEADGDSVEGDGSNTSSEGSGG